jgi:hypothetical protein
VVPLSGGAISCRAVLLSTASPPESVPRPVYMGSAAAAAGALILLGLFAWGLAQSIQIAKLEQRHESAIGPSGVRMEAATRPSTTPMTPKPARPAERSRGEPMRRPRRHGTTSTRCRVPPPRRPSADHTGGRETHYHPDQKTGHRVASSRDRQWLHHVTAGGLIAWRSTVGPRCAGVRAGSGDPCIRGAPAKPSSRPGMAVSTGERNGL